jgi:hypothetical protein
MPNKTAKPNPSALLSNTIGVLILCWGTLSHAEIPSQAFSGLNHFIPTHARLPIYKLKAQKSRVRIRAAELANKPAWGEGNNFSYAGAPNLDINASNCSLSIGNIAPGTGAAAFGAKETIVYIEGDVVNASDCTR